MAGGQAVEARARPSRNGLRRLRAALREAIGTAKRRRRAKRLKRRRIRPADLGGLDIAHHWEWLAGALLKLGGASSGNGVTLFCNGDETLSRIWEAIDGASRRVWFETYILEPDKVGARTIEVLTRAAERGCEVVLLYDALGSPRVGESLLRPLRQAGRVTIHAFNPIWPWPIRRSLLRRDHRKIIVIDGKIGFCGGMNISEDYAGPRFGNCRFRDCHIELRGPSVRDLAEVFADSLRRAHVEDLGLPRRQPSTEGDTFVQVLSSSGRTGRRAIQRALRMTIRHAARECFITTPYFVPPQRLMRAVTRAARRGVDVRILTAGLSDVPIVRAAAQHIYGRFLHEGVRIFEMFDTTLHAKTIVIDGLHSTVGSFNLDQWSDLRNLEVNVAMIDPAVAEQVQADFEANLKSAQEVTLETWQRRPWWRRTIHWLAYQLLRL